MSGHTHGLFAYMLMILCVRRFFVYQQDDIELVILVGGSTRVPKVQEVLLKATEK